MTKYTEYEVNQALESIANGQSVRKASVNWGVPRSTIRDRLQGSQSKATSASSRQKLSTTQENHLVQWIQVQASLGLPPTHQQIREFTERILYLQGGSQTLGKNWFQAFLYRNPSIKVQRARYIDSQHINRALTDTIRNWFRYLSLPEIKAILPANWYNIDETGILEGQGSNGLILGSTESRNLQKK